GAGTDRPPCSREGGVRRCAALKELLDLLCLVHPRSAGGGGGLDAERVVAGGAAEDVVVVDRDLASTLVLVGVRKFGAGDQHRRVADRRRRHGHGSSRRGRRPHHGEREGKCAYDAPTTFPHHSFPLSLRLSVAPSAVSAASQTGRLTVG